MKRSLFALPAELWVKVDDGCCNHGARMPWARTAASVGPAANNQKPAALVLRYWALVRQVTARGSSDVLLGRAHARRLSPNVKCRRFA